MTDATNPTAIDRINEEIKELEADIEIAESAAKALAERKASLKKLLAARAILQPTERKTRAPKGKAREMILAATSKDEPRQRQTIVDIASNLASEQLGAKAPSRSALFAAFDACVEVKEIVAPPAVDGVEAATGFFVLGEIPF